MNPKTVGIYARVSTTHQDCETQLLELKRYCQARDWSYVEYVDSGFSGSLGQEKRPALKDLMKAAQRRKIDGVLVWDFSRFARSLRHLIDALDCFRTWGISFLSLREGVDTETANGRLMFGIFASLAEFERELTRERILLGLKKARARGKVPGPRRNIVDLERLRQGAAKGLSLRQLAGLFHVSKDTVRNLLQRDQRPAPSRQMVPA